LHPPAVELTTDNSACMLFRAGTLGVAGRMWDAGIVLLKYLSVHTGAVAGKVLLELGAGTGIVGLAAARLGAARVYITDMEPVCPLMAQNVALSGLTDRCVTVLWVLNRQQTAYSRRVQAFSPSVTLLLCQVHCGATVVGHPPSSPARELGCRD
jgi:predicted RNA methylase